MKMGAENTQKCGKCAKKKRRVHSPLLDTIANILPSQKQQGVKSLIPRLMREGEPLALSVQKKKTFKAAFHLRAMPKKIAPKTRALTATAHPKPRPCIATAISNGVKSIVFQMAS
jgi:hypothetical protein